MTRPSFPVVSAPALGCLVTPSPWRGTVPPPAFDLDGVVRLAESAGLRGRGGAGFPLARKLRAVSARRRRPVVAVNAAEGEPASGKDSALLRTSPHLVLDGAEILARALGTRDIRVWAPGHDRAAVSAIEVAAGSRPDRRSLSIRVTPAPDRFVAGESSAAARGLSGREAVPRADGRRTSDTGVDGRPTLLVNAETAAQLARLAYGLPPTRLVTVLGAVAHPGVVEVEAESPLPAVLDAAGGLVEPVRAFVLGGYHGEWWAPEDVGGLRLGDPAGPVPDCSIVVALPDHGCLLAELEEVARYLSGESARQCGPCAFGLPALADTVRARLRGALPVHDVESHRRVLAGRGACHHPDGSLGFVSSALQVLAGEIEEHRVGGGSCGRPLRVVLPVGDAAPSPGGRTVLAGWSS